MSAKFCFVTAVLAVTAFTLASSCPVPVCEKCKNKPVVNTQGEDITIIIERFKPAQCINWFKTKPWGVEIIPLFETYKQYGCGTPAQTAFYDFLYQQYDGCAPETVDLELLALLEFIKNCPSAPGGDSGSDSCSCEVDIPECDIVRDCNKNDIFGVFETCPSDKPVYEFFLERGYKDLAAAYQKWKAHRNNKCLENSYRKMLYDTYRGDNPKIKRDTEELAGICNLWSLSPSEGGGSPLQIKQTYAETCVSGSVNVPPQVVSPPALPCY